MRLILTLAFAIGAACPHVMAQPGGPARAAAANPRGAGGPLPEVGSTIPDITLYDDRGETFSTRQLRGQYSVLIFGCLT